MVDGEDCNKEVVDFEFPYDLFYFYWFDMLFFGSLAQHIHSCSIVDFG